MKKRSVFIVGGGASYHEMFRNFGWDIAEKLEQADLVQFTGGEDVTPVLYGCEPHPYTGNNWRRDLREIGIFNRVSVLQKPMAGICRGGQFLNVMCGGKLYQDVDNHAIAGEHPVVTEEGITLWVTSTHHQMMIPAKSGEVLAYTSLSTHREFVDESGKVISDNYKDAGVMDTEVVFYPDDKVLCFQPHPEHSVYSYLAVPCAEYYFECLERLF